MTEDQRFELLEMIFHAPATAEAELAVRLGVAESEVADELAALRADGILRGSRAIVDWERAGAPRIFAFVDVRVRPEADFGFDAVAQRVALFEEVVSLYLISGAHDLLAVVSGNNLHEVARFVSEKLAPLKGVEHCVTSFVLRKYKADGESLMGDRDDVRLAVSP